MEKTDQNRAVPYLLDTLINIAVAVIVFALVVQFIAQPHQVEGSSMAPNFHDRDYVITEKITQYLGKYDRGDVVVFRYPKAPTREYIKRIVVLPGERVSIRDGKLFINGRELKEPYLTTQTDGRSFLPEGTAYQLEKNEYLVMGDNRPASSDSREWGPVPEDLMVGEVIFRYWPFSRIGFVN